MQMKAGTGRVGWGDCIRMSTGSLYLFFQWGESIIGCLDWKRGFGHS